MSIELQNSFELSRQEWGASRANRKPDTRIADALAAGRFVVFEESEVCCPRTDAVMGSETSFVADFATREEAEGYAYPKNEDDDMGYYLGVRSPVFYGPVAPDRVPDDDVPF